MKHLWEIEHPYHCSESNYRVRGVDHHEVCFPYDSWDAFFAAWGESDPDMNLLFRWDWKKATDQGDGEMYPEHDTLYLFWMMQRKGDYRWCEVKIQDEDELRVKAWLSTRWQHMQELWEGIA